MSAAYPQEALVRRFCDGVVRWLSCGVVMVLAVVLSGCGSGSSPGVSAGSSGLVSAGSAGSADGSVDARAGRSSVSQADLDAEAERVYRAFFDEEQKIFLAGGAESLPDSVKPYVTGDFAKMSEAIYQEFHRRGWKQQPGTTAVISGLEPDHASLTKVSLAVLATCTDTTKSGILNADGGVRPGGINYLTLYFWSDSSGVLKIFNSVDKVVEKCPLAD